MGISDDGFNPQKPVFIAGRECFHCSSFDTVLRRILEPLHTQIQGFGRSVITNSIGTPKMTEYKWPCQD